MFVTNKRALVIPNEIVINGYSVEIVESFKLLGVTIDRKLTFLEHISDLRRQINSRLYSIEQLFYLPLSVKLQLFKSLSTISIYYPRSTLQKVCNTYNQCLHMLLRFNPKTLREDDILQFKIQLSEYNLYDFDSRLLTRLATFVFKVINETNSPKNLRDCFVKNYSMNKKYNLRNSNDFHIPSIGKHNVYLKNSFQYFFPKFANILLINELSLKSETFKFRIKNNAINLVPVMRSNFDKFNLEYKVYNFEKKSN